MHQDIQPELPRSFAFLLLIGGAAIAPLSRNCSSDGAECVLYTDGLFPQYGQSVWDSFHAFTVSSKKKSTKQKQQQQKKPKPKKTKEWERKEGGKRGKNSQPISLTWRPCAACFLLCHVLWQSLWSLGRWDGSWSSPFNFFIDSKVHPSTCIQSFEAAGRTKQERKIVDQNLSEIASIQVQSCFSSLSQQSPVTVNVLLRLINPFLPRKDWRKKNLKKTLKAI